MTEKRIQQVIEIEKQAEEIHQSALREAGQLPAEAEQESQALIAKIRAEAEEEARGIVAAAQGQDQAAGILAEAEGRKGDLESKAKANFDKAVAFVLDRVTGRE
jgi:vacuolar-type H+-ATPase subunit H